MSASTVAEYDAAYRTWWFAATWSITVVLTEAQASALVIYAYDPIHDEKAARILRAARMTDRRNFPFMPDNRRLALRGTCVDTVCHFLNERSNALSDDSDPAARRESETLTRIIQKIRGRAREAQAKADALFALIPK